MFFKENYTYEINEGPTKEQVDHLYEEMLGRNCDKKLLEKILKNGYSLQRIRKHILNSNEYREKKNSIFNFSKWVEFGTRYNYLLKPKVFVQPPLQCNNNLVFIDFRYLENMEFVIRNALLRLEGKFMVTFVCGLANYDEIKILCSEISSNIRVLKLDKHINSQSDYNDLLLDVDFWKKLEGSNILLHQFDAFIFKSWNDEFLDNNYLGAPCYFAGQELIVNGGFSFRKKEKMISLLETHRPSKIFEDMFFSKVLEIDEELCRKFAFQEKEFDAFGGHKFWEAKNCNFGEIYAKLKYEKTIIFNILLRVTYRPKTFTTCISSIFSQNYENYNILISYDDNRCLEYLKKYQDYPNINIFKVEPMLDVKCFYNLYCNILLDKVEKDWIIFLDDDDMFKDSNCLEYIAENIKSDNDIVFWNFKCGEKVISPDIFNITEKTIASSSYVFNIKNRKGSLWKEGQLGDFYFIENLLFNNSLNRIKLDKILTKTIDEKVLFGSLGTKEVNPYINAINYKKALNYSKQIIKPKINLFVKNIINKFKDKTFLLTISNSIIPPAGGGENWLLTCTKILNNYQHLCICFEDKVKNIKFDETKILVKNNITILQMPLDYNILGFILSNIKPKAVLHQGGLRNILGKLFTLLDLNFISCFCFWNDLIEGEDIMNIDMINRKYKLNDEFLQLNNDCNFYCPSEFVQEICFKNSKINLKVIENITENIDVKNSKEYYVTLLNCHPLKGGQEFLYLLYNLDISIPLCGIITEYWENFHQQIIEGFKFRNKKNNINKLYLNKQEDISKIYGDSKIILIPSLVDETFCRVAYESKLLDKYTISYNNGNLKYILKNYGKNTYIKNPFKNIKNYDYKKIKVEEFKLKEWKKIVENQYFKCEKSNPKLNNDVEKTKHNLELLIENPKNKKVRNSIGIYGPFSDQGLGIQMREYYTCLEKHGKNPVIYHHIPDFSKRTDPEEWENYRIFNSKYHRHNLEFEEILFFVYHYNIKTIIIPEVCFDFIFRTINFFKLCNVKIVCPINIETLRYSECDKYNNIDVIAANNQESYNILKNLFGKRVKFLDFNTTYMKKRKDTTEITNKIIFSSFGGLNSFFRKNIDVIYKVFSEINYNNFHLNLHIQGHTIGKNITLKNTRNISVFYENKSYSKIIECYKNSHFVIHLGSHEGLGLGFFETLNNNVALITLDTFPNKEYVNDGENGFLVKCNYKELEDNCEGVVNKAILDEIDLKEKIINILEMSKYQLENMILRNKYIVNNYETNLLNII